MADPPIVFLNCLKNTEEVYSPPPTTSTAAYRSMSERTSPSPFLGTDLRSSLLLRPGGREEESGCHAKSTYWQTTTFFVAEQQSSRERLSLQGRAKLSINVILSRHCVDHKTIWTCEGLPTTHRPYIMMVQDEHLRVENTSAIYEAWKEHVCMCTCGPDFPGIYLEGLHRSFYPLLQPGCHSLAGQATRPSQKYTWVTVTGCIDNCNQSMRDTATPPSVSQSC